MTDPEAIQPHLPDRFHEPGVGPAVSPSRMPAATTWVAAPNPIASFAVGEFCDRSGRIFVDFDVDDAVATPFVVTAPSWATGYVGPARFRTAGMAVEHATLLADVWLPDHHVGLPVDWWSITRALAALPVEDAGRDDFDDLEHLHDVVRDMHGRVVVRLRYLALLSVES